MIQLFYVFKERELLLVRPALFPTFLACTLSDDYIKEQQHHKSNNVVSNLLIATDNISLVIRTI